MALPDSGLKRLPPDEVLRPLLADWAREGKRLAIVCFIDLDRFADVNQRLGMAGGNAALEEARRRLKDRKSTRLNSSHLKLSRMPSSA